MNQFQTIMSFYRQLPVGQFITRKMYMDAFKGEIKESILDNYRCMLMRAGFIFDSTRERKNSRILPLGIYLVVKKIPKHITSNQLYDLAYPKPKPLPLKSSFALFLADYKASLNR